MSDFQVTAEDLLAGAAITFEVSVPTQLTHQGTNGQAEAKEILLQLRPLTIGTFQLIMKAARQDAGLIPLLMIKESLVQPALSLEQVKQLHLGLVNFLIAHIREISGLTEKKTIDRATAGTVAPSQLPPRTCLRLDTTTSAGLDYGTDRPVFRVARPGT